MPPVVVAYGCLDYVSNCISARLLRADGLPRHCSFTNAECTVQTLDVINPCEEGLATLGLMNEDILEFRRWKLALGVQISFISSACAGKGVCATCSVGIDFSDCVEKSDLVARAALHLWRPYVFVCRASLFQSEMEARRCGTLGCGT